jgi:hypothetical protein
VDAALNPNRRNLAAAVIPFAPVARVQVQRDPGHIPESGAGPGFDRKPKFPRNAGTNFARRGGRLQRRLEQSLEQRLEQSLEQNLKRGVSLPRL